MIPFLAYSADCSSLTNSDLYNYFYGCMPHYRQNKIDSITAKNGKFLSLGAGVLLKYALLKAGINDLKINFQTNENGKPYISEYPECFFSLSHSKKQVMAVISGSETGCDVEQIKRCNLKIAERFFTKEENNIIAKIENENLKKDMFCRIWTLKESYVKAVGKGLSLGLDTFSINPEKKTISIINQKNGDIYNGFELTGNSEYHYSCFLKKTNLSSENIPVLENIDFYRIFDTKLFC